MGMVRPMLEGWTGRMPQARVEYVAPEGTPGGEEDVILTPDKENAVYIAGRAVEMNDADADYPALFMAGYTLGGTPSGRLFARVREKEGLSYGAGSGVSAPALDKNTVITARAIYNPANAAKVRAAMAGEISLMAEKGVTEEELSRDRGAFFQERVMARSQERNLVGILSENLYAGRTMAYTAGLEEAIRMLTAADVSAAAMKYLRPGEMWVVTAGDFEKGKKAGATTKEAAKAE